MISPLRIITGLVVGSVTLGLMLSIYYLFIPNLSENLGRSKYMDVTIRLQNECSIIDDAFIVEVLEHGRSSKFYNDVALMRLPETAKVKLSISPAFPDFVYDGSPETVAANMTLVADCSVSPRLKSIFGAMRDRFGN